MAEIDSRLEQLDRIPKTDLPLKVPKKRDLISREYLELKSKIHDKLLDIIDLTVIDSLDRDTLAQEIRRLVEKILAGNGQNVPLNLSERERLAAEIQDEVLGLGPIEPFMKDPTVSDILVNTHKQIYLERFGKLESARREQAGG